MKQYLAIFKKEIIDNLRDRRSLFFALLYGPVLLPLLMLGPMAIGIQKHTINFDETVTVAMLESERAPNLIQFLRERNVEVEAVEANFQSRIAEGELKLVLKLSERYAEKFRAGEPATITLYYDGDNDQSTNTFWRLKSELQQYSRQLSAMRMQVRGIDSALLRPLYIVDEDLSLGSSTEKLLARIIPFIVVLALILGGFYLAVDSTAGERERHSLEPLLTLGLAREKLVLAKFMAVMCFVAGSGLLAVLCAYLLFNVLPIEELTLFVDTRFWSFIKVFLITSPLIVFFTSAMMAIATFARNTKEAQTHLGFAMMVPMAPFFIIQFANVKSSVLTLWTPVMSQFLLVEQSLAGQALPLAQLLQSATGAILGAGIFLLVTFRLYRKESIFI